MGISILAFAGLTFAQGDNQTFIPCMGDNQTLFSCPFGDAQTNNIFSSIITVSGGGGNGNGGGGGGGGGGNGILMNLFLTPHYYVGSNEVSYTPNQTKFDGISFDVIAFNYQSNVISNITISSVSPISLSITNTTQSLTAYQNKTLWSSKRFDLSGYTNGQVVNFTVGIIFTYNIQNYFQSANSSIIINKPTGGIFSVVPGLNGDISDFFINLGNYVYPDNYTLGLIILLLAILLLIYIAYRIIDKYDKKKRHAKV